MSGFGQNPQGASAFSFPTSGQPNATAPSAPAFNFGAPKATAVAAPLGAAPAFGTNPSLGVKASISMPVTSTAVGIPNLGTQPPGTLFGTSWPSGMFSAGTNVDVAATSAAALPSLAPAAAVAPMAKTGQFTFGTSAPLAVTQGQPLMGPMAGATTTTAPVPPGFSVSAQLTPAATQATVAPSAPTLNFSFGANTSVPSTVPTLGLSVPAFGVPQVSKPQAAAAPIAVATTLAPLASTTLKFSVASSSAPVGTAPLPSVTKTSATMAMPMFAGAAPSATPQTTSTPAVAVSVAAVVAPTTTAPVTPTTSISGSGVATTTVAATPAAATTEEDTVTYSKLQENINKWAMELEKQEKIFLQQATEMNGWDRVIVENSDKLHMLNSKIEKVRKEQRHLDLELDYILSQQNELDHMLKGLEKEWGSVPPSDPERQHTYKIAESLDYKLKLMSEDLKEVVDHMNAMNYPPNDEFNPVMQIVRILNAHMNVLLMVERKTNLAECKVKEVGKLLELCKRDYDRACHLYFD